MAIDSVMKNIFSFANILQQATSDNVATWSSSHLANALKWAEYCENIHKQTLGRPYYRDFDDKIRMLCTYVEPRIKFDLNLHSLSYASSLLKQIILANYKTPQQLFDEILFSHNIEKDKRAKDVQLEECRDLIENNDLYELAREFLRLNETNESTNEEDVNVVKLKAQQIFDNLSILCCSDVFDTYRRDLIHQVLGRVSSMEHGWAVIVHTLLVEYDSDLACRLRGYIEEWICESATNTRLPQFGLWRLNVDILSLLASQYSQFRSVYLQHLMTWSQSMVIRYRKHGLLPRYDWRHPTMNDTESNIESLISHLTQLYKYPWIRQLLHDHIRLYASRPRPNIWLDIFVRLKQL